MKFRVWFETDDDINSWLGNSVIKTPVYHGTHHTFQTFAKTVGERGTTLGGFRPVQANGFFFAINPDDAKTYGPNLITAYIRLTKPLLGLGETARQVERSRERLAHLGFILRHVIEKDDSGRKYTNTLMKHNWVRDYAAKSYHWVLNILEQHGGLPWSVLDNSQVVQSMKRLGYDGSFVVEPDDSEQSVFVIDADQIRIVSRS